VPVVWEGLNISSAGLLPGDEVPLVIPYAYGAYHKELVPDKIRYGNGLDNPGPPTVWAPRYPLPTESAAAYDVGAVLTNNFETKYKTSDNEIQTINITVTSKYDNSESISYAIVRDRNDVTIALGGIANQPSAAKIAEQFPATIATLPKLIPGKERGKLPAVFSTDNFVIISPYEKIGEQVRVSGRPREVILAPMAVLTDKFEPIASTVIRLFLP
jgi:hypothetical protein